MMDVTWLYIAGQEIKINPALYLVWCIWVGWIFSTVGAFGGIMAGVGHISILGIGSWAGKLKGVKITKGFYTDAGKYITDHIRMSNTALTWLNSLSSTINWYTQKRLVWPAGLAMGLGMIIGAQVAVWGTGGALGIKLYKGIFGFVVLVVAFFMFYQVTPRAKASKSKGREAAKRFRERVEQLRKEGRLKE
ncbi:MAG TPA: sulfite exporter TauE/SafE family protein, partial [Archaeoglobus sp.]|nr:sulfite exporter TauE/SafE family protein [Archaeoglobus sp.]